jgi:ubiquinone/menaquinone biosynthesis C-methylase UbiE
LLSDLLEKFRVTGADIVSLRKQLFAWMFHVFITDPGFYDAVTRDTRAGLLNGLSGEVLEIGAGDGINVPLYPPDVHLTLLEPNRYLLSYMVDMAESERCPTCYPVAGFGERLPFAGSWFDAVVSTHVLCSVSDQARVLAEILRVLRPGGMFLFLEHVAASNGTATRYMQRLLEPPWRFFGGGCHLTRDTETAIRQAGFGQVELESYRATYPAFLSPHVKGRARK